MTEASWFLRKEGRDIFGPEPMPVLVRWAAEGRIAPEDELSEDRSTWVKAPAVQPLRMEWLLDLGEDASYGPLPALAYRDALRQGAISLEARMRHAVSGQEQTFKDLLQACLEDAEATIQSEIRDLLAAGKTPAKTAAAPDGLASDQDVPSATDWKSMAQAIDQWKREAIRWRELRDHEHAAHERAEEEWRTRLNRLQQSELEARREAEREKARTLEWQQKYQRLYAQSVEGVTADGEAAPPIGDLLELCERLSSENERHEERLLQKNRELAAFIAERKRLEDETRTQSRRLDEQLAAKQKEADDARAALAQIEHEYAELLRSYRELNERLIRMRPAR